MPTTSHFVPLFSLARWAILTFLVWWTRFRSSIIRISERRVSRGGPELIRGEGPVLWLYSSFLAPSLGSNRSPDFFYRQLLKAGRLFGAFRRGVKHRDSPPVSPSGGIVRMSSWLLWVPFNYSSSNWAVFLWLNGRGGFSFPVWPKVGDLASIFRRLVDFKTRRTPCIFSVSTWLSGSGFFSHPPSPSSSIEASRPRTHPQPRVSISGIFCVGSHGRHKWAKQTSESTSPVSVRILGVRSDADVKHIEAAVWQWKLDPDGFFPLPPFKEKGAQRVQLVRTHCCCSVVQAEGGGLGS